MPDDLLDTVEAALKAGNPDCEVVNLFAEDCAVCEVYANARAWLAKLIKRVRRAEAAVRTYKARVYYCDVAEEQLQSLFRAYERKFDAADEDNPLLLTFSDMMNDIRTHRADRLEAEADRDQWKARAEQWEAEARVNRHAAADLEIVRASVEAAGVKIRDLEETATNAYDLGRQAGAAEERAAIVEDLRSHYAELRMRNFDREAYGVLDACARVKARGKEE